MWRWIGAAGVCVIAVLVWWFVRRSHDRTPSSTLSPVGTSVPSSTTRRAEPTARPAARTITRVSPEQRQALRTQIERARVAQSAARPPALPDAASSNENAMDTPEQVLNQVMGVLGEVRAQVADCRRYAPRAKGFTTQISLVGDADIGTLIDAPSALVPTDGDSLPAAFDDCVRDVLQALELPPMRTGEQFNVTFNMSFDDEGAESSDRR